MVLARPEPVNQVEAWQNVFSTSNYSRALTQQSSVDLDKVELIIQESETEALGTVCARHGVRLTAKQWPDQRYSIGKILAARLEEVQRTGDRDVQNSELYRRINLIADEMERNGI